VSRGRGRAQGPPLGGAAAVHWATQGSLSSLSMLIGLDHFIVAVDDPDDAAAQLESEVGLRAGAGGRHAAHGTHNRLIWLGDTYIELMGVFDRDLARASWFGSHALRLLDETGGGQMGLVLAADDIDADVQRLRATGSSLGQPESGERVRPDGGVVRWHLAHAAEPDPELGLVFLIEHDTAAAEWTPEERARRAQEMHPAGGPVRLVRVELPVHDMKSSTMRLHRDVALQFRPSLAGGGARDSSVGEHVVRLVRAASGVLPRVVLRGGDERRQVAALGCQWLMEPVPA
jgi:hypothetical protein